MPGGYGQIKGGEGNVFSSTNQPENRGRKKDPFKEALEELSKSEGYFPIAQNEIKGLVEIREDTDGSPLITIRGEWAKVEGEDQGKKLALIVVQLPEAKAIVAQWYRDAKSRQANIRMRSRETLIERLHGKPVQPIEGKHEIKTPYSDLTDEELAERLANLNNGHP